MVPPLRPPRPVSTGRAGRARTRRPARRLQAELVHRLLGQGLDPDALLGPGHLVPVGGVDQRLEVLAQRTDGGPRRRQAGLGVDPRAPRPGTARPQPGRATVPPAGRGTRRQRAPPQLSRLTGYAGAAGQFLGPGLPLDCSAARRRASARPARARIPLLQGAQREPGLHLGVASAAGPARPAGPARLVRFDLLGRLGQLEPVLELSEPGDVGVPGLLGLGDRPAAAARPRPEPSGRST